MHQRNNISEPEIIKLSEKICGCIIQLSEYLECESLFCYQSFSSEVDTKLLIQHAWDIGKKVAIPKVAGKNKMDFCFIEKGQLLKENCYGILEPISESGLAFPDEKTMFIIPGLVFDKNGYRIGYGAGYYDFYLAEYKPLATIGICFDFQVIDNVYPDLHDIPVSKVVTEKSIY